MIDVPCMNVEAVRKMGMTKLKNGKLLRAKTMVIGATGAVGQREKRLLPWTTAKTAFVILKRI